jgi:hypothetical protein
MKVKRPESEANHSHPSCVKNMNSLSYTSTPQHVFILWCLSIGNDLPSSSLSYRSSLPSANASYVHEGRTRFRIPVATFATLTEDFRGYPRSLEENSGVKPLVGLDNSPQNPFQCTAPYHPAIIPAILSSG